MNKQLFIHLSGLKHSPQIVLPRSFHTFSLPLSLSHFSPLPANPPYTHTLTSTIESVSLKVLISVYFLQLLTLS